MFTVQGTAEISTDVSSQMSAAADVTQRYRFVVGDEGSSVKVVVACSGTLVALDGTTIASVHVGSEGCTPSMDDSPTRTKLALVDVEMMDAVKVTYMSDADVLITVEYPVSVNASGFPPPMSRSGSSRKLCTGLIKFMTSADLGT